MAFFSVEGVSVQGISACVPKEIRALSQESVIDPAERDRLIEAIGIRERRLNTRGLTSADLCAVAAERLLADLNWDPGSIQVLVFVSQSRDLVLPQTAGLLQERLGLSKDCAAFDLPQGCAGYVYGLLHSASLLAAARSGRALLLAGEAASYVISEQDASTYPLFGEAGSATALSWDPYSAAIHAHLQTDGSGAEILYTPAGGFRRPHHPRDWPIAEIKPNVQRALRHLVIDGVGLFEFTQREVAANAASLLNKHKMSVQDIQVVYAHQANRLLNEVVRRQLGIDPEQFPYSLEFFGNTSSASIPLTMVLDKQQTTRPEGPVMLVGFGAGLSWGSVILGRNNWISMPLLEV